MSARGESKARLDAAAERGRGGIRVHVGESVEERVDLDSAGEKRHGHRVEFVVAGDKIVEARNAEGVLKLEYDDAGNLVAHALQTYRIV